MADYNKYDPRVDSLVVETRTLWDPALSKISEADKQWFSTLIHKQPHKASKIDYERTHTGFIRTITVTQEDIARIYAEEMQQATS
ncbi:MAG: hypothetical protein KatS3mg113_0343 [Planctomycetaceae bacterium]|nr:MAG: hypothetical protein KatS3mg113_0343 [Planctomycetaceae bacterium]